MNNFTKKLIALIVFLFLVFILGLIWLAGVRQEAAVGGTFGFMAALSFAAGLSMIVLPCTLPLVFIIVPLAAGREYKKGLLMAVLFGLGLTITISIYFIAMAYLGKVLGISAATPWLLAIAGAAAYIFGLSELGIVSFRLPFAATILPQSLQEKGDYVKSFSLGLLLGNAGIGCPNPFFYVLLLYTIGTANPGTGLVLGFIHGVGRALPVILLVVLAMLGVGATQILAERQLAISKVTGWLLILIGAFLLPAGFFNLRGWWIISTPINFYAVAFAIGLIALPAIVKLFRKES